MTENQDDLSRNLNGIIKFVSSSIQVFIVNSLSKVISHFKVKDFFLRTFSCHVTTEIARASFFPLSHSERKKNSNPLVDYSQVIPNNNGEVDEQMKSFKVTFCMPERAS